MPKYKCHKEVWAFKIKQIVPTVMIHEDGAKEKGKIMIFPEEEGYQPFEVSKDFIEKHKPQVGGYYVKYKDGYESYSPADAFEEGYSKIEEEKSESNKGYVSGWIAVTETLPKPLQTVWLTNGKGWVSLGCLVESDGGWHWAQSNGIIYIENGEIVSECESEDLDVNFWHELPKPPCL